MSDSTKNEDFSELNEFLTSYFQIDSITKINYNQYIGPEGNEQWCFHSDLYMRSRDSKTLVSLFSKELWCFSLNDDPVPVPFERKSTNAVKDNNDMNKSPLMDDDDLDNLSHLTNDANNKFSDPSNPNSDGLQNIDLDVIDLSLIQERLPDKTGHFNGNFAKPNLPTSYAIFLKAVKRLIYLNLSASSFNKFIPFGNSCLTQNNDIKSNDTYKVLNISPHLFENGCLSVSINYKNLALNSFKRLIKTLENSSIKDAKINDYAVYLAPSGVRCFLSFSNDELKSCISKTPPKNATKILKILKISHGIDLFQDEITWVKVIPSILHLSGQTPSIFNYLKEFEVDAEDPENKNTLILWPLELIFFQTPNENIWGVDAPKHNIEISLEDAFQMKNEINDLNDKLKLKFGDGSEVLNEEPMEIENNGIASNLPLIQHSSPFLMLQQGSPVKMMPPSSALNNEINNFGNHANNKYLLSVGNTNQMTGTEGVSVNMPMSQGLLKTHNLMNNKTSNVNSPFFKIKSNDTSPQFGGLEKDLFDDSHIDHVDTKEFPALNQEEGLLEDEDDMDVDDEMRDLFGDDEEEESLKEESVEKVIGKKRPFKLIDDSFDTPKSSAYSYEDPGAPVANSLTPAFQDRSQNHSNIANSIASNSDNASTIKERRSSVYSHINFNPLINSVDSKYKLGGKFAMSFNKSNVPEGVFADHIVDEQHNNNSLIKQENGNSDHGNVKNPKDNINLQEIIFQASRKLSSGGFNYDEDIYEEDVSSDEDDNGMISIKDITNTNMAVPLTSIIHTSNKNNLSVNTMENYQSLPYTNMFNTNNMNSIKETSFFPLSVLNEINPALTHSNSSKSLSKGYPLNLSNAKNSLYKNESRENQLLIGTELYKSQSPTSLVSPGLITGGNGLDNLMMLGSNKPTSPDNILEMNKVKENLTLAASPEAEVVEEMKEADDEVKTVNVLPFVLRHMPIFSIPFIFFKSFEKNSFMMNVDKEMLLQTFEKELIFNNFISEHHEKNDVAFGRDNVFYRDIEEVKDIFLKLFPTFKRLSLGSDMLGMDKRVEDVFKENHLKPDDKMIVLNDFSNKEIAIKAKDLKKWYNFDVKPLDKPDKSNDLHCCIITDSAVQSTSEFMTKFNLNYTKRKFGDVKFISGLTDKGVLHIDSYDYNYIKYCSVNILKDFVGLKKATDLVIFLPLDIRQDVIKGDGMKKFAFFVNLKKMLLSKIPATLLRINLHFVPNNKVDFTTLLEMNKICLSVFNKVSISDVTNKKGTSFFSKLDMSYEVTRNLKSDILMNNYNVPIVTTGNVPYFNICKNNNFDNYIIVCYSRSIDKNYLTASWVLPDGTNFNFKTWRLEDSTKFEKVCDEIWRRTMAIITTRFGIHKSGGYKLGDSNCIILTRLNSILPDDELVHWRRLSSRNKNVSLAVVCANFNTNHNAQVKNDNVHFAYFKNSLPLSNSQHRCSIKTGAVINANSKQEIKNNTFCDYLEINLLNCPHSSASVLLDEIMWKMYCLSLLNPTFGITEETVVPFNILIIERVLNKVIHMDF